MADPMALVVADAAARAVELVGLPEAQLNLAQAVVHLAVARRNRTVSPPRSAALRGRPQRTADRRADAPSRLPLRGAAALGHGEGYEYPHDDPEGLGRAGVPPARGRRPRLLRAERPRAEARCRTTADGTEISVRVRRRASVDRMRLT